MDYFIMLFCGVYVIFGIIAFGFVNNFCYYRDRDQTLTPMPKIIKVLALVYFPIIGPFGLIAIWFLTPDGYPRRLLFRLPWK